MARVFNTVNVNDIIRFKPTERCKRLYQESFIELEVRWKDKEIPLLSIESDGFCEMQLHEFMRIFGKYMTLGFNPIVEDNIIFFPMENRRNEN